MWVCPTGPGSAAACLRSAEDQAQDLLYASPVLCSWTISAFTVPHFRTFSSSIFLEFSIIDWLVYFPPYCIGAFVSQLNNHNIYIKKTNMHCFIHILGSSLFRLPEIKLGLVAQVCIPSYLGGWSRKVQGSRVDYRVSSQPIWVTWRDLVSK